MSCFEPTRVKVKQGARQSEQSLRDGVIAIDRRHGSTCRSAGNNRERVRFHAPAGPRHLSRELALFEASLLYGAEGTGIMAYACSYENKRRETVVNFSAQNTVMAWASYCRHRWQRRYATTSALWSLVSHDAVKAASARHLRGYATAASKIQIKQRARTSGRVPPVGAHGRTDDDDTG